ncbi:hypothetical protein B0H16DRAFT_1699694 [Mycena metata]|uniref:Uncharacterized protein n=1 Tax=Mycena metata TaxID=1033252 RepID=A0AAD7HIW9_9AGAR|nr:hypothetical protein B0H16DRAFT_1699694 [Mycena metata]
MWTPGEVRNGAKQRGPPGMQETVLKEELPAEHPTETWTPGEVYQGSGKAVGGRPCERSMATWTTGEVRNGAKVQGRQLVDGNVDSRGVRNGAKEVGGWVVGGRWHWQNLAEAPQASEGEDELEEEEGADRGAGAGKPAVPAIEALIPTPVVGKENTALTMDTEETTPQLGKRKRPAEDKGEGRELVDGAADNVLATRRARRTESEAAWQKCEVLWCSWNVERKNREKKQIDKFEVGGRDGGRGRRGDVREWRCDVRDVLLMGDVMGRGFDGSAAAIIVGGDDGGGDRR